MKVARRICKIEVLSVRLIEPKESGLTGFSDVLIDPVIVREFRIFRKNGGKPFIQAPYNTIKKDGRIEFHPIIDLPEEIRAAVDAAILSEYFRKRENANEENTE